MSLSLMVALFHLLLLMMMSPTTEGVDEHSAAAAVGAKQPAEEGDLETRTDLDDGGGQSELVSRRRWYSGNNGGQLSQWNDHDMQWLKRDGKVTTTSDDDKRGWGNGIPPWLRRRVIVGQYQLAQRRSLPAGAAV